MNENADAGYSYWVTLTVLGTLGLAIGTFVLYVLVVGQLGLLMVAIKAVIGLVKTIKEKIQNRNNKTRDITQLEIMSEDLALKEDINSSKFRSADRCVNTPEAASRTGVPSTIKPPGGYSHIGSVLKTHIEQLSPKSPPRTAWPDSNENIIQWE